MTVKVKVEEVGQRIQILLLKRINGLIALMGSDVVNMPLPALLKKGAKAHQ